MDNMDRRFTIIEWHTKEESVQAIISERILAAVQENLVAKDISFCDYETHEDNYGGLVIYPDTE